jgi:methionyl aminopeptidase
VCIYSEKDLIMLERIGKIVSFTREEMIKAIKPGVTTKEIDIIGENILLNHGARSAPKYEYNFPGCTCISVNNEIAHGIPGSRILKSGDVVNIDVSAELNGFFADTGATVVVSSLEKNKLDVCECSKNALQKGIESARAGLRLSHIGKAIHSEAKKHGFTVIKNLTGHGIGRRLHEEPTHIFNYINYFNILHNQLLKPGNVLAIEAFVSTEAQYAFKDSYGWILKAPISSIVAQFEHTIVVTENEPIILTK